MAPALAVTLMLLALVTQGRCLGQDEPRTQQTGTFSNFQPDSDITGSEQHVQLIVPVKQSLGIKGHKNVKMWQPYPIWKSLKEDLETGVPENEKRNPTTVEKAMEGVEVSTEKMSSSTGDDVQSWSSPGSAFRDPNEEAPATALSVEEKTKVYEIVEEGQEQQKEVEEEQETSRPLDKEDLLRPTVYSFGDPTSTVHNLIEGSSSPSYSPPAPTKHSEHGTVVYSGSSTHRPYEVPSSTHLPTGGETIKVDIVPHGSLENKTVHSSATYHRVHSDSSSTHHPYLASEQPSAPTTSQPSSTPGLVIIPASSTTEKHQDTPSTSHSASTTSDRSTHGYQVYETTEASMQTVGELFKEMFSTSGRPLNHVTEESTSTEHVRTTTPREEVHEVFHSTAIVKPCERSTRPPVQRCNHTHEEDNSTQVMQKDEGYQQTQELLPVLEQQKENLTAVPQETEGQQTSLDYLDEIRKYLKENGEVTDTQETEQKLLTQELLDEQKILDDLVQVKESEDFTLLQQTEEGQKKVQLEKLELTPEKPQEGNATKEEKVEEQKVEEITLKPVVNIVTEISVQWTNNQTSENTGQSKESKEEGGILSQAGKAITDYIVKPWQLVTSVFKNS